MRFAPCVIADAGEQEIARQLHAIGCHATGVRLMAPKGVFKVVKLHGVPAKAANLLKQTMLAKGGDAAVASGSADLSVAVTDVLVMGTLKQLRAATAQLKMQPWGLPDVAAALEEVVAPPAHWPITYAWRDRSLTVAPGRTLVMGILNVTPDSFSDGGRYNTADAALRHAANMVEQGVDIIDIGAESTRPYGARKISADEELSRLMPVLERLVAQCQVPISVDTYKASVAQTALAAGAHIINDIWGLQGDPAMAGVAAAYGAPVVVMHNKEQAVYGNIMAEIIDFLQESIRLAVAAGLPRSNIIVDPGIGFAKNTNHNLTVLRHLEMLQILKCPVLLGTSRKRFIGEILQLPAEQRAVGTAATAVAGVLKGVNIVRVHDVAPVVQAVRMADAIVRGCRDVQ